ncbi:MAG: hypothetical protein JNK26_02570 [Candidatus Doudnabacteria bacterium]|nr:hypothetical protein [Candidatus Doudnabacteria bacterium]
MKKQQILWTIGACLVITVSIAIAAVYYIPQFANDYLDVIAKTNILPIMLSEPTHGSAQIKVGEDNRIYVNDTPIYNIREFALTYGQGEPIIHFSAITPDRKIICSFISMKDSFTAFVLCNDVKTAKTLWSHEFDAEFQFPDRMYIEGNILHLAITNTQFEKFEEKYIIDTSELILNGEGSTYDLQDKLQELVKVENTNAEEIRDEYSLRFDKSGNGILEARFYCKSDCDDSVAGGGADYELKLVDGSWQITKTRSGAICRVGRGGEFASICS